MTDDKMNADGNNRDAARPDGLREAAERIKRARQSGYAVTEAHLRALEAALAAAEKEPTP